MRPLKADLLEEYLLMAKLLLSWVTKIVCNLLVYLSGSVKYTKIILAKKKSINTQKRVFISA